MAACHRLLVTGGRYIAWAGTPCKHLTESNLGGMYPVHSWYMYLVYLRYIFSGSGGTGAENGAFTGATDGIRGRKIWGRKMGGI